ncbi:MAG: hypothetical protein WD844_14185 [Thermoleophilaceae bacterium]
MTLPRPALFAILGGVLILAVFALTRATGQADDSGAAAPAPAPAAEAPAPAAEEPVAEPAAAKPADSGVPAGLEQAIEKGQVAVLAFTQEGGAEDDAVRAAVGSLSGVPVFVDDVTEIAEYRKVVGELDLDRAPAVVIVRADGKAEVIEGYVDPGSLAQQVEDAR